MRDAFEQLIRQLLGSLAELIRLKEMRKKLSWNAVANQRKKQARHCKKTIKCDENERF